jgi:hypothetical protein
MGHCPPRLDFFQTSKISVSQTNALADSFVSDARYLTSYLTLSVFAENFFSGQIPTELSSLPRLKGLSFSRLVKSGRKLSGGLPAFDKTPQLQSLVLNGNELTGSIPSNFMSSASGARFVDLSSNFLTGSVPVGLDTIAALISD